MLMLYSFELFLAGIILFSAMFAGGISLWIKRRKEQEKNSLSENDDKVLPE